MKIGDTPIGSNILIDLNRDGNKCIVATADDSIGDSKLYIKLTNPMDYKAKKVIVEITNSIDEHVYCFKNCVFDTTGLPYIESYEDVDYKNNRQERRFRYKNFCLLKHNGVLYHDASFHNISLSGAAFVVPMSVARNMSNGDSIVSSFKYIDGTSMELIAKIVRMEQIDGNKCLLGCMLTGDNELSKLIIERQLKVN